MVRVLDLLAISTRVARRWDDLAAAGPLDRRVRRRRVRLRRRPTGPARRDARRSARHDRSGSSGARAAARRPSPASCCGWSNRPRAWSDSVGCRSPTSRWPSCAVGSRSVSQEVELFAGHDPRQRGPVRRSVPRRGGGRRAPRGRTRRARRRRHPSPARCRRRRACRPARPSCCRSLACGCAIPTCSCSTRRRRASTRRPSGRSRPPSPG